MARNLYTTVDGLRKYESDRHLAYLNVSRADAVIADADVQERIADIIEEVCRDFDSELLGHQDMFADTETALTGTITLTVDATTLTGVGTAFDTELAPGDRIALVNQDTAEVVIDSIDNATTATLRYQHYGETEAGGNFVLITNPVLTTKTLRSLELLTRGHACYTMWSRRGGHDEDNPWTDAEARYNKIVDMIKRGMYRYKTDVGDEVAEKPIEYDDAEPDFTKVDSTDDDPFEGFFADD